MVPCSSPYHRSPWWVTTGAAPWCGPWPASIPRESGKHTHRHTQSPRACTVKLKCFSMCVKGCGIVEHPNVQVESFGSCFRETEGYSNIRLSGLLPNTSKCYIYIYILMFVSVTEKLQLHKWGLCFRVWRRPSWRRIWRGRSRFSFPAVVKRCVDRMYTHTQHCSVQFQS